MSIDLAKYHTEYSKADPHGVIVIILDYESMSWCTIKTAAPCKVCREFNRDKGEFMILRKRTAEAFIIRDKTDNVCYVLASNDLAASHSFVKTICKMTGFKDGVDKFGKVNIPIFNAYRDRITSIIRESPYYFNFGAFKADMTRLHDFIRILLL